jgi:hypothetical protein
MQCHCTDFAVSTRIMVLDRELHAHKACELPASTAAHAYDLPATFHCLRARPSPAAIAMLSLRGAFASSKGAR